MSTVITNRISSQHSGVHGAYPTERSGSGAPDGDAWEFAQAALGSRYIELGTGRTWTKRKNDQRDDDWSLAGGVHVISQHVTYTDFTDGGGASGTLVLDEAIPVGAYVLRTLVHDLVGFTGDSSAAMEVGDGTDEDRYTASSDYDVFTTAAVLDGGAPQGVAVHIAAKNITLTITTATNWGSVVAGSFTFKLFYLL